MAMACPQGYGSFPGNEPRCTPASRYHPDDDTVSSVHLTVRVLGIRPHQAARDARIARGPARSAFPHDGPSARPNGDWLACAARRSGNGSAMEA